MLGAARMATPEHFGLEARFVQGVLAAAARVEAISHRGEWLLLHRYPHEDGEAVRAVTRVEPDGDRIARLRNYFFSPDFIAEVCGELAVPWRSNGYRWFLPKG
jgi:RNA polymerase sigma-70 factor (ECF subfamily)